MLDGVDALKQPLNIAPSRFRIPEKLQVSAEIAARASQSEASNAEPHFVSTVTRQLCALRLCIVITLIVYDGALLFSSGNVGGSMKIGMHRAKAMVKPPPGRLLFRAETVGEVRVTDSGRFWSILRQESKTDSAVRIDKNRSILQNRESASRADSRRFARRFSQPRFHSPESAPAESGEVRVDSDSRFDAPRESTQESTVESANSDFP